MLVALCCASVGCERDRGVEAGELADEASALAPASISFEVDHPRVRYVTFGPDGRERSHARLASIALAERAAALIFFEEAPARLDPSGEYYVATLLGAAPQEIRAAELRSLSSARDTAEHALRAARLGLAVKSIAMGQAARRAASVVEERTSTPTRRTRAAKLAATPKRAPIRIEVVGTSSAADTTTSRDAQRPAVTVYFATWCGVCDRAMAWLDQQRVPYRAVDIEASAANRREMRELCRREGLNPGAVPTIRVGDRVMQGWSADAFSAAWER